MDKQQSGSFRLGPDWPFPPGAELKDTADQFEDSAVVDQQWRGYDLRAAIPLVCLALVLTIALLAGRWWLDEFVEALVPYVIVLILWPAILGHGFYRSITYTYRLTDQALIVDLGFRNPPVPPIRFSELIGVEYGASRIHSLLGIGWVEAVARDERRIRLKALRDPAEFAALLRERIPSNR